MSIPQKTRQRRDQIVSIIEEARTNYYQHDKPTISDEEYDKLFVELQKLESDFPELVTSDSPTQSVGGEVSETFGEFEHPSRGVRTGRCW